MGPIAKILLQGAATVAGNIAANIAKKGLLSLAGTIIAQRLLGNVGKAKTPAEYKKAVDAFLEYISKNQK